jgi:DNA-binding Xre family transcriptional regulator
MLKLRIRFVLESKGITNPYNFLIKEGFTPNIATRYLNGKVDQLSLRYLEKLCIILQCTPHDLLEWEPSGDTNITEAHPLYPLIRNERPFDIVKRINKLPLSQVKQVQEFIEQMKSK